MRAMIEALRSRRDRNFCGRPAQLACTRRCSIDRYAGRVACGLCSPDTPQLAPALCRDEIIKFPDLGVEQLQGPLAIDAVPAEGRGVASHHRLEEVRAVGAAVLIVMSRVNTALAQCRPAELSRGEM